VLALDFPPIAHLIEWPDIWLKGNSYFAINKVVLLMFLAFSLVTVFFFSAARKKSLVPTGVQNMAETVVDFVHEGIILQTMGPEGLGWAPFLLTVFSFVFVCNVFEIIPGIQMPVTARIALPAFLAVVYFVLFMYTGFTKQGPIKFFKHIMFPPDVPIFIYLILTPVNLISDVFVRPFALAVRLFANLLAGHLILVSFVVLSTALWESTKVGAVAPGALLIALTGFELLVSFLQAYIITILIAVFIGGAMESEHH
jgi:F-type H+-transporting ATPase subunit a